jgi:hypothetical protein
MVGCILRTVRSIECARSAADMSRSLQELEPQEALETADLPQMHKLRAPLESGAIRMGFYT